MCEYIFLMFSLVVRLLMNFIASSDNQRVPLDWMTPFKLRLKIVARE